MAGLTFLESPLARTPLLVLALLALLAGCATAPPAPEPQAPPVAPGEAPPSNAPAASAPAAPVVEPVRPSPNIALALREESARAVRKGDPARAVALLERAIRIEPQRADLWLDLAELHLRDGDVQQAEQLARKARALAPGDDAVVERAKDVLTRVRALRETG